MQNRGFLSVLLLVLCTCAIQEGRAQHNCELYIKGVVLTDGGEPLADAVIHTAQGRSASSDRRGHFMLERVCQGEVRLTCTHLGYRSREYSLQVVRDTVLRVVLEADAIHLRDVEIIGKQAETLSASIHRLSRSEAQQVRGKTLGESLLDISGMSTIGMGNSIVKPVINGLHSNRILIMNNGIRQEGQQWGAEHAPEIDPFVADRLEVIKGAQGVRYGADALGGVIVASPHAINTEGGLGGRIDVVGQSNGRGGTLHGMLEGNTKRFPKLGWRVQATGKKLGNYKSADYYVGNTGVEELNYSAALQYHDRSNKFDLFYSRFGTQLGIFVGAHIGTAEDIEARIQHGRPFEEYDFSYSISAPRQKVTHDLLKASWKYQIDPKTNLEVLYGFQRNHRKEYDVRRVESDDLPMADMVLTTQSLDAILKRGNTSFGLQSLVQVNNNTPGTGTTPIIPNFDNYTLGAFGIHQFHINRLHAELGARYDFKYLDVAGYRYRRDEVNEDGSIEQYLLTDTRRFHNASGTFGVLYHFSPQLSWKSNIGLAWRAPSANELYSDGVHHGSATYEVGDRQLRSEKGLKWVNTLLFETERANITLDVHAQMIYDYIYAQPNPDSVRQTIRGTFPIFSYRQHDAFFYGADLKWTYRMGAGFDYGGTASVLRARNISLGAYLPYIPADRLQHGVSWHFGEDGEEQDYIRFAHRFVARQTRYEANSDYAAPPPAYHLLDFYVSRQFNWNAEKRLVALLSVENLLNKAYKDYMDRFRYFTHQIGRNINLKVSYKF